MAYLNFKELMICQLIQIEINIKLVVMKISKLLNHLCHFHRYKYRVNRMLIIKSLVKLQTKNKKKVKKNPVAVANLKKSPAANKTSPSQIQLHPQYSLQNAKGLLELKITSKQ